MCLCEKFLFKIFALKGTLLSLFLSSGKEMCLRVFTEGGRFILFEDDILVLLPGQQTRSMTVITTCTVFF
jgi:hypothetical protein